MEPHKRRATVLVLLGCFRRVGRDQYWNDNGPSASLPSQTISHEIRSRGAEALGIRDHARSCGRRGLRRGRRYYGGCDAAIVLCPVLRTAHAQSRTRISAAGVLAAHQTKTPRRGFGLGGNFDRRAYPKGFLQAMQGSNIKTVTTRGVSERIAPQQIHPLPGRARHHDDHKDPCPCVDYHLKIRPVRLFRLSPCCCWTSSRCATNVETSRSRIARFFCVCLQA